MPISKLKKNFFLNWLILLLITAACTPPSPKPRLESLKESATFYLDKASISQVQTVSSERTALPLARVYTFEACLKDNSLGKSIENHSFQVLSQSGQEPKNLLSDPNGCIRWNEEVSFNYLATGRWVSLDRKILAHGFHAGEREISFAIQPWDEKSESLLTTSMQNLTPFSESQKVLQGPSTARVIVDDLRITINEKIVGKLLLLDLKTAPQLHIKKSAQRQTQENLSQGSFKMDLEIYALTGSELKEKTSLGSVSAVSVKVQNGLLLTKDPIEIKLEKLCQNGIVELSLKLSPEDPELEGLDFSGVFNNLGDCDQIKGGFFAKLKSSPQLEDGKNSARHSLNQTIQNDLSKSPTKASEEVFGNVVVRELMTSNVGFFGNPDQRVRDKIFSITACLVRPLDKKPLSFQEITVRKLNGTIEKIETQLSGCLTWDDSFRFNQFDTECWTRKSFQLQNSTIPFSQTLEIDVNPFEDGPNSVRDARRGKPQLNCHEKSLQLVMQSYEFDLAPEGIEYQITQFLGITILKSGIFKMPVRMLKSSNKNVESRVESPVPPGRYRLRWAIIDGRIKNWQQPIASFSGSIYQAHETLVDIIAGGTISQKISLVHSETKAIGNLNSLLIEIEPILNPERFEPITFAGSILFADRKEPGSLEPIHRGSSLIKGLMQQSQKDQRKNQDLLQKMTTPEFAAQEYGAQLIKLNEGKTLDVFIPQLKDGFCSVQFLNQLPKEIPKLKGPLEDLYKNCLRDQKRKKDWLKIDSLYFVKDVQLLGFYPFTNEVKSIGNGFMLSYGKDFSKTGSVDINGGFNTGKWLGKISDWISPLSIGGGGRYQIAWSKRESHGNAVGQQAIKQLLIEKLPFQLKTTEYNRCALVGLTETQKKEIVKELIEDVSEKGLFDKIFSPTLICEKDSFKKEKVFREQYTLINQLNYGAQVTNLNSENARAFFMLIRGEGDYLRLMKEISQSMTKPETADTEYLPEATLDKQFKYLFDQPIKSIPGVFIERH